jgi:hypothetical protein
MQCEVESLIGMLLKWIFDPPLRVPAGAGQP